LATINDLISNRAERTFSQSFIEHGMLIKQAQVRPGYYYQFNISIPNLNENWIPDDIELWKEDPDQYITEKNYYDLSPAGLLLYHENWKKVALVLNLKVMPPVYRLRTLAAHYTLIEKYIQQIYQNEKKVPFNERERLNSPFYGVTPSLLKTLSGIDLSFAINNYDIEYITNARVLDWDKFGELPYAKVETQGIVLSPGSNNLLDVFNIFENNQF